MRSSTISALSLLAAAVILGTVPTVLAHGNDDGAMDVGMDTSVEEPKPDASSYEPSYFTHPDHRGLIHAHVALMVIAWVVLLPIGE